MTSVNKAEINHFKEQASKWWDETGPYKILHQLNPVRLRFIKEQIVGNFADIKKLSVLDVGCGGGLVALPLAKQGFRVTAIDAEPESIGICKQQAKNMNVDPKLYNCSLEELINDNVKYDVITALEIVEHVDNLEIFLRDLVRALNKGGILIISTINKTLHSLMVHKIAAEYISGFVPKGTHDWNKFVKPELVSDIFESEGLKLLSIKGFSYSLFDGGWQILEDLDGNYIAAFVKE